MSQVLNSPRGIEGAQTFEETLGKFAKGSVAGVTLTAEQTAFCVKLNNAVTKHPRLGKILKHFILARYEQSTGIDVGTVDWKTILTWFVANAPKIMEIVLSLLAMFGM